MVGWIKLRRSLIDWEWYDDKNATRLLIHLLVSVNHQDKKWHGEVIKAGSRITSWDSLSADTGLSPGQTRRAMKKCEASGEVVRVSTNKWQLVTLVKWDKFQGGDDDEPIEKLPKHRKARKTVQPDPSAQSSNADSIPDIVPAIQDDITADIHAPSVTPVTEPSQDNNMKKKTTQSMGTIRTAPVKKGPDFIDEVVQLWRTKYREHRGHDYEVMTIGKERGSAGKLVAMNKRIFPNLNKEQAMEKLAQTFVVCLTIDDNWLWKNMSMSIIVSRFNEIKNYVTTKKNGGVNGRPGITAEQRDEIIARVFGAPPEGQQ